MTEISFEFRPVIVWEVQRGFQEVSGSLHLLYVATRNPT